MNNQVQAQPNTQASPLSQKIKGFNDNLNKYENNVADLLGEKYGISAKEFMVCIMNAVKKTPKLLECDPKSLFGAILLSAELGLKPNTPEQFAFILPYGKEAQFQVGYKGLIEISYRSPKVRAIKGVSVYANEFYREYDDGTFKHIPFTGMDLNIKQLCRARSEFMRTELCLSGEEIETDIAAYKKRLETGKGDCILAYAICFIEGMDMPIWTSVTNDVLKRIEKLSPSAKSNYSPYNNGTDVHNSMQFKAAIKKLFKFLPKQALPELAKAIDVDDKIMAGSMAIMTEDGEIEIIEPTEKPAINKEAERIKLLINDATTMQELESYREAANTLGMQDLWMDKMGSLSNGKLL